MSQSVTPPALQGYFYPSAHTRRCGEYAHCRRCHCCANYNVHSAMCTQCESRKPQGRHCRCTIKDRHVLIEVEKKIGKPLFDKNGKEGGEVLFQTNHDQAAQELVRRVKENADVSR